MKNITAKITGGDSLLGKFTLQEAGTKSGTQSFDNVKLAKFAVDEGKKYSMLLEVIGTSGEKYKLVIDGATKASYPEDEQTLDDGRDFLLARITG